MHAHIHFQITEQVSGIVENPSSATTCYIETSVARRSLVLQHKNEWVTLPINFNVDQRLEMLYNIDVQSY